jgi:hypothetical protein
MNQEIAWSGAPFTSAAFFYYVSATVFFNGLTEVIDDLVYCPAGPPVRAELVVTPTSRRGM